MKKALALILALAIGVSLVGCGSSASSAPASSTVTEVVTSDGSPSGFSYEMIDFLKDYDSYRYDGEINVLYLVCTTLAEYFPSSFEAWEPVLKENNINIDLVGPPSYSDESLISTLESSLATGKYDVVLLYPITPQALTPLLDTVWESYKVPIVAYAFDPSTGCGHYYMGTSYYSAGTVLGQSIVDYVNANAEYYDTLETIPVAVYKNSAGAEQYQRVVGALDVLKADGRFSIIDEYEANGEANCLAATETLLTSYPNVEVILTQIDNDVTGTYQAVTSGIYKCSDYLSIWGFDATGAVMSLMDADGKDGFAQGSSFINHEPAGKALVEFLPIVVGAAKKGELISFTDEQVDQLGKLLADYYVTVTPENVSEFYKK